MELSSPRFKALAVTAGFSLWFFIISSATNLFSIEAFTIFVLITISITQIFAIKLSKALDIFAIINTKVFLGILFVLLPLGLISEYSAWGEWDIQKYKELIGFIPEGIKNAKSNHNRRHRSSWLKCCF